MVWIIEMMTHIEDKQFLNFFLILLFFCNSGLKLFWKFFLRNNKRLSSPKSGIIFIICQKGYIQFLGFNFGGGEYKPSDL